MDKQNESIRKSKYFYNVAIGHISFELNFEKYLQKKNIVVKTELPKLEDFLK